MVFKDIEYEIVRSKRKTLALQVTRDARVVVRSPLRISEQKIIEFLALHYTWVKKALSIQSKRADIYDLSPEQLAIIKQKANEILPKRVEYYSQVMQLFPTAVKINFAKTRFGSCSSKNSINFSAYLMLFPLEAVDYVIVHELAHIKYKNHQKEFYALVEKYMPDYKKRAALLKR